MGQQYSIALHLPLFRIQFAQLISDGDAERQGAELLPVIDVNLHTAAFFAGIGTAFRREANRHETEAGQTRGGQGGGQPAAIDPRSAEDLEGTIGASADAD